MPATTKHCVSLIITLAAILYLHNRKYQMLASHVYKDICSICLAGYVNLAQYFLESFSPLDPNALECWDSKPNIEFARVDLNSIR